MEMSTSVTDDGMELSETMVGFPFEDTSLSRYEISRTVTNQMAHRNEIRMWKNENVLLSYIHNKIPSVERNQGAMSNKVCVVERDICVWTAQDD